MIAFWNRKELTVTFSTERQSKIRELLKKNGIPYTYNVVSRGSVRARGHSFGSVQNSWEYIIYVHKRDYEKAKFLLGL